MNIPSNPVTFYQKGIKRIFLDSVTEPDMEWDGFSTGEGTISLSVGWHRMRIELQTPMQNGVGAQLGWENGEGTTYQERFPNGYITVDYLVPPAALRHADPQGGGGSPVMFKEALPVEAAPF